MASDFQIRQLQEMQAEARALGMPLGIEPPPHDIQAAHDLIQRLRAALEEARERGRRQRGENRKRKSALTAPGKAENTKTTETEGNKMATATTETWDFTVTRDGDKVTVTSPGGKSLTLDVSKARKAGLRLAEVGVVNKVNGAQGSVTLTREEMLVLVAVRNRTDNVGQEVAQGTAARTHAGIDIRTRGVTGGAGVDAAEAHCQRLEKVVGTLDGAMWMLIYDIPTTKNDACPNPSALLWHYGFRLNLSCWVLPEKSLQAPPVQRLLRHWQGHGIEQHLIRYHDEELGKIRGIAREKLRQEVIRLHTALIERIAGASERLEEARKVLDAKAAAGELTSPKDYEVAERSRDNQVRAILKGAGESLAAALDGARAFDETEALADLFAATRAAIRSEALGFNAQMEAKKGKPAPLPA